MRSKKYLYREKKHLKLLVFAIYFIVASVCTYIILKENSSSRLPPLSLTNKHTADFYLVGYDSATKRGSLIYTKIELQPGEGRILINSPPAVLQSTVYSIKQARLIASEYLEKTFDSVDIIVTFDSVADISGTSGGGAFAVALIAVAQGFDVNDNYVISGTVNLDGFLGSVEKILEKYEAVKEAGKTLIVSQRQENINQLEGQYILSVNSIFDVLEIMLI